MNAPDPETATFDGLGLDGLACPGLFYSTLSGDGVLSRIRTPGGLLTAEQAALVAEIAEQFAGGIVTITNRANLQLRALTDRLPGEVLLRLQQAGLASHQPLVDHLRNVMASPTAGLDPGAVLDTRPLVGALDAYIAGHPHLAPLPAKISFGLDGGERASIASLPNDILFRAYRERSGAVRLRVVVRIGAGDGTSEDLGLALTSEQVVPVAAALAEAYLSMLPSDGSKPRLRHLLAEHGREVLRQALARLVSDLALDGQTPLTQPSDIGAPIGVHAQRSPTPSPSPMRGGGETGLACSPPPCAGEGLGVGDSSSQVTYIGIAPLVAGRLSSDQLRRLAALAKQHGSGSLRLSPWRNVLIPDVPAELVETVQDGLHEIGLAGRAASLASGIVACAGRAGCSSGTVDTVRDAEALSARLRSQSSTRSPVSIHFTGCGKCCAQRRPASLTLLGRPGESGRYDLYVGGDDDDGDPRLGRLLLENLPPEDALATVERLVVAYDSASG